MLGRRLCAMLIIATMAVASPSIAADVVISKHVTARYDKFKELVTIEAGPLRTDGLHLASGNWGLGYLKAVCLGDSVDAPEVVSLQLLIASRDWQFSDPIDRHIELLLGDQHLRLAVSGYTPEATSSGVNETISCAFQPALLDTMAVAKSIEIQAGGLEFSIKPQDLPIFGELSAAFATHRKLR